MKINVISIQEDTCLPGEPAEIVELICARSVGTNCVLLEAAAIAAPCCGDPETEVAMFRAEVTPDR